MRLVGFLADEGGFWSLSPRWRQGSHAVLWKPDEHDPPSFVLTSASVGFAIEELGEPAPRSGVQTRRIARPPSIREPEPPSMTRVHQAAAPAP